MNKTKNTMANPSHNNENLNFDIRVEKYRGTRYWSIWIGEELLAVTVYKKGAVAIKNALTRKRVG
ncbi:MAG: hypothetical protein HC877_15565 [Thioploca sp.]|nr:hypothetical protein [Thioploca sp.]